MSKDLNQWSGIGRLGQDPEIRALPDGRAVANLSIACGDDYKDKSGQRVERTEWVRCVAFGKTADVISQYVKKGSRIMVQGKLTTRSWEKEGQTHYTTEIHISNMFMLDSKPAGDPGAYQGDQTQGAQQQQQRKQATPPPQPKYDDEWDDDIHF